MPNPTARPHELTRFIAVSAILAATVAVCSQISVPFVGGVPLTLQTFALALCGFLLGWRGIVPVAVYLALGAAGAPVFAGMNGGAAAFIGPTSGFLFGFMPFALLSGLPSGTLKVDEERRVSGRAALTLRGALCVVCALFGLAVLHTLGILGYLFIYTNPKGLTAGAAFAVLSAPFLIKDIISVILAYALSEALRRRVFGVSPTLPRFIKNIVYRKNKGESAI